MRVGIVGAGITGLALTHHLADRGADCVTLEAAEAPGGVMRSERVDGVVVERGPQRIRLTPGIRDLVDEAGLGGATIEAPELPVYVYADGRLGEVPFDRRTFVRTGLLSWRGKLRLLAEPLTRRGRGDESVARVFRRKFGAEAYRNVFGPLFGGIYGSDPERMPARHALGSLLEAETDTHSLLLAFRRRIGRGRQYPSVSFEGGLGRLAAALAERYADRVHLGRPVTDLDREGDGYRLETAAGPERVDRVVLTVPGPTAGELLTGLAEGTAGLRDLTYNPFAMVALRAEHGERGMGYQVGFDADVRTLGTTWNGQLFGRDGLQTAFLGGMRDPTVLDRDDREIGAIAAREFEVVTGAAAEVLDVWRLDRGFPAYDESWDALEALALPEGVSLATNYTARSGVPSRVREARELAETLAGD
jgi:oxygen-dependent protoporphyrinogen oxidase